MNVCSSDLIGPNQKTILVMMSTVSISELKANLSRYLREVRRGGEVQVLDRGAPVARLVPAAASDDEGIRKRLIGTGLLRPGNAAAATILDEPTLVLPVSVSEALIEDRTDRL
jgi:prevent-host-death family protein